MKPDGEMNLDKFIEQRESWKERNEEMRQIGSGIHEEFLNLDEYLKKNFLKNEG